MSDLSSGWEILVGPVQIYYAPVGTVFPEVDAEPGEGWETLGESDEDGVTVSHPQSMTLHRTGARTGPVKASREEEDLIVSTNLAVFTLENLSVPVEQAVTEVAGGVGTVGTKELPMHRGLVVNEYAYLLKGKSAYGDYPAQYQIPRAVINGDLEVVHNKSEKAVIPLEITALEDLSAADGEEFGIYVMQHEPAQ